MSFISQKLTRTKGFFIALFLLLSLLFLGIAFFFNERNLKNFIVNEEREAESDFARHGQALKEISDLVYTTMINTDEVHALYRNAFRADEQERSRIRSGLYTLLEEDYRRLHTFRIQQLHFQLPNNESFLRFHKPEQFGDDLSGIRPTIEYVNRTHKPISGFEEGRIFNGFRYVYPLMRGEEYFGSVEISSSALSYKEAYELDQKQELDIVVRADVVESKVFHSEQSNYIPYPMNPNFRLEKSMESYDKAKRSHHEHKACLEYFAGQKSVMVKMDAMEKFTVYGIRDGRYVLVTFLPLSNAVSDEKVAYAIVFRESEYLKNAFRSFVFESILAVMAAFIVTLVFYFVQLRLIAKEALEEALIMAEEASRAKDTFLSTMSHELRTPLNAIIGFSQILIAKPDTPEMTKSFIEKIYVSGKNLLTLVNSILDFSKIESGKMEVVIELFYLNELIDEIKILTEPMKEKKGIELAFEMEDPITLCADRQLIKQVFLNLLSNAIKFSPDHTKIRFYYEHTHNHDIISIDDQGPGIPKEKISTLFDPFTQIREHQNGAIKGTGLGLAIVKKIVELHGGEIRIVSTVGVGSTFVVTLPDCGEHERRKISDKKGIEDEK